MMVAFIASHYAFPKVDKVFCCLFFYSLGTLSNKLMIDRRLLSCERISIKTFGILLIDAFICAVCAMFNIPNVNAQEYGNLPIFLLSAICGISFIMTASMMIENNNAIQIVLSYVGQRSLWVMCLHFVMTMIVITQIGISFSGLMQLAGCAVSAGIVALCLLCEYVFKKTKVSVRNYCNIRMILKK